MNILKDYRVFVSDVDTVAIKSKPDFCFSIDFDDDSDSETSGRYLDYTTEYQVKELAKSLQKLGRCVSVEVITHSSLKLD